MNDFENFEIKKSDKRIFFFSLMGVLSLIAAIFGATYAYFAINAVSDKDIVGQSAYKEGALTLDIQQTSDGDKSLIPQEDAKIQDAVTGASGKGTCIDADDNTTCKVYSITVTNTSNVKLNITGTLSFTAEGMNNLKWANGTTATTGFPNSSEGPFYATGNTFVVKDGTTQTTTFKDAVLEAAGKTGASTTFYIVVWISETGDVQSDSGTFTGTVNFSGYIEGSDGSTVNGITSSIRG